MNALAKIIRSAVSALLKQGTHGSAARETELLHENKAKIVRVFI